VLKEAAAQALLPYMTALSFLDCCGPEFKVAFGFAPVGILLKT
jgi:hypothetical protein